MQHLVREKRHPQAYMAAPQVQAVELHRLCGNAAEGEKLVSGCGNQKGCELLIVVVVFFL